MIRWKVLSAMVRHHGWQRGAEIGVWKGQTLYHLLDTCPGLVMIGVDNWDMGAPREKDTELGVSTWYPPEIVRGHRDNVFTRAAVYGDRLTLLEMDSVAAADHVPDGSLDFAFVDGDHSTDGVLRDVAAWRPKIRAAGTILGHDEQWESVRRALEQLFPSGWTKHQDHIWSVPL